MSLYLKMISLSPVLQGSWPFLTKTIQITKPRCTHSQRNCHSDFPYDDYIPHAQVWYIKCYSPCTTLQYRKFRARGSFRLKTASWVSEGQECRLVPVFNPNIHVYLQKKLLPVRTGLVAKSITSPEMFRYSMACSRTCTLLAVHAHCWQLWLQRMFETSYNTVIALIQSSLIQYYSASWVG